MTRDELIRLISEEIVDAPDSEIEAAVDRILRDHVVITRYEYDQINS